MPIPLSIVLTRSIAFEPVQLSSRLHVRMCLKCTKLNRRAISRGDDWHISVQSSPLEVALLFSLVQCSYF